jgi:hypothetical protein
MGRPDRRHFYNPSIYKFYPVVFAENSRFDHPMILLDGKAVHGWPSGCQRHEGGRKRCVGGGLLNAHVG